MFICSGYGSSGQLVLHFLQSIHSRRCSAYFRQLLYAWQDVKTVNSWPMPVQSATEHWGSKLYAHIIITPQDFEGNFTSSSSSFGSKTLITISLEEPHFSVFFDVSISALRRIKNAQKILRPIQPRSTRKQPTRPDNNLQLPSNTRERSNIKAVAQRCIRV